MKEFLELNFKNYNLLIVLLTIVVAILISKYLSRYIATFIFNVFNKAGRKLNKNAYYNILIEPLKNFILWSIILFSLEKLSLPPSIKNFSFYGKNTIDTVLNALSAFIFITVLIRFVLKVIDYTATILEDKANKTLTPTDDQLIYFFKDFFKAIIIIFGGLLILKYCFGHNIGNLLTGLSIVGAAIALATKESLENLIASFIIFFDKPFTLGDEIKVQNITGFVERIGLRSTRIRTYDKTFVTVPNKQMVDTIVDNQSLRTQRKFSIKINVDKKVEIQKLNEFMESVKTFISTQPLIINSKVLFTELGKINNTIQVDYFTSTIPDNEFDELKEKVNIGILTLLQQYNIEKYNTYSY